MPQPQRMTTKEDALTILKKGEYGVLSLITGDGEPYGVPLNYCYDEQRGCVYFHCALTGKKLEAIASSPRASLAVVTQSQVVAEEIDTRYESAVVNGAIARVEEPDEMLGALRLLCARLAPGMEHTIADRKCMPRVAVIRLTVQEITGKRNDEI